MANNNVERIHRVLPLVVADGEVDVTWPLAWSLPGNVEEFNEPEITIIEAEAVALAHEICAKLLLQQVTYYVADGTEGQVEKAVTTHRLTKLMPVPNAAPGASVDLDAEAGMQGNWQARQGVDDGIDVTLFEGTCKIRLQYAVHEEQEVEIVKAPELDGEILSETVEVESVLGRLEGTFDLKLPVAFAEVPRKTGALSGRMVNVKASSLCGWVKVEGDIITALTVLSEDRRQEVFVYPVTYFMEAPLARTDMSAEVWGTVQLVSCEMVDGESRGTLRGLLKLDGRLSLTEPLALTAWNRSYQTFFHPLQPQQNPFLLEEVVASGSSQTLVQREIIFPRPVRKVREPVVAEVRSLQHEIIPNKVIVRGVLSKQIFAVDAETGVVFAVDVDESFVHFVDVPGASPRMRAHVRARVEFVQVDPDPAGLTARQVAIVEVRVKVTRFVKKELVSPEHPAPSPPAQTVYTVRSGDSIWKIANMFGVSMQAIIDANNLTNPSLIFPGQQLIIPTRR